MISVFATFRGRSSLGYITGNRYKLEIHHKTIYRIENITGSGSRNHQTGRCAYESINTFFENWTDVIVVEDNNVVRDRKINILTSQL